MQTGHKRLDRAEERIADEQSSLGAECDAFEEFRDAVSLARTTAGNGPESATETERLRAAYRETVMSSPDFEETYGESLAESLENEFSAPVANALSFEDQVTQRLKRDLLVGTNEAIERRERVREALDAERESIERVREALVDIDRALAETPVPTLRALSFEEFLETWETCEELACRCERLLEERQSAIADIQAAIGGATSPHALNEYLYGELETTYPALEAIARTRRSIERHRRRRERHDDDDPRETSHEDGARHSPSMADI
jgi:hypothetical protein